MSIIEKFEEFEEEQMQFNFIKRLVEEKNIGEFEKLSGIKFDEYYKEFIKKYNGSRPSKKVFKTIVGKEHLIKGFLSFNREDRENIFDEFDIGYKFYSQEYVAIANDPFGNLILMSQERKIYYFDLESGEIELIANSFESFLESLED